MSPGMPRARWLVRAIAVLLVVGGFALAVAATASPQCCDAVTYQEEARSIIDGEPQLLWVHNYAYPAFLALLGVLGLDDRLGVAIAQATLLYAAVLAVAIVVGKTTRSSVSVAMVSLGAVALIPASAWSGYTLSEGLAAPLLLLVLALVIAAPVRLMRDGKTAGLASAGIALGLGYLSGIAWMVRPGLLWIPLAVGLMVLGVSAHVAWRGAHRALLLPVCFVVGVGLAAAPQVAIGDPFKLDLARAQAGWSELYFRYATDLTGCGPAPLHFSPLADEYMEPAAAAALAPDDVGWRITAAVAHVVTGWDARPSATYLNSYTDSRWVVPAAGSGFAIMAAISAAAIVWRRRWRLARPRTVLLGALALLFVASQATLAMTAAEFRFNLAGWLIAGCCLAVVTGIGWWTKRRAAIFIMLGLLLSSGVLLVGELTLMDSAQWLRCSGMVP